MSQHNARAATHRSRCTRLWHARARVTRHGAIWSLTCSERACVAVKCVIKIALPPGFCHEHRWLHRNNIHIQRVMFSRHIRERVWQSIESHQVFPVWIADRFDKIKVQWMSHYKRDVRAPTALTDEWHSHFCNVGIVGLWVKRLVKCVCSAHFHSISILTVYIRSR